jgi:hypothetical protein
MADLLGDRSTQLMADMFDCVGFRFQLAQQSVADLFKQHSKAWGRAEIQAFQFGAIDQRSGVQFRGRERHFAAEGNAVRWKPLRLPASASA